MDVKTGNWIELGTGQTSSQITVLSVLGGLFTAAESIISTADAALLVVASDIQINDLFPRKHSPDLKPGNRSRTVSYTETFLIMYQTKHQDVNISSLQLP